ncbi:hypothetical protein [Bacilliculturomica massiliensis]|uniref:hypothetical protein n=1 Tax=Bacilliculturomica massiliensis TaxID=1917867 RepID=UPI001031DFD4|nr:hypothetical protein [Bacilliculturomica massiliensis]
MRQFKVWMQKSSRFIFQLSTVFEGIISLIILICIGIELVMLVNNYEIFSMDLSTVQLRSMLSDIMWLVIGLEFIKMLLEHSQGAVLDVMLFAIARQMLLEHGMLDNLAAVLAIGMVFAIRKFLYDQSEDRKSIMDTILDLLKDDKGKEVLEDAIGEALDDVLDEAIEDALEDSEKRKEQENRAARKTHQL